MNEQQTKTCPTCGRTLPIECYNHCAKRKDGCYWECKQCVSRRAAEKLARLKSDPVRYEQERAILRERARRQYVTTKGPTPEQKRQDSIKRRQRYPEKYAAACACSELPKIPGMHIHHWSYNAEHRKDVISVPMRQHNLVHRFMTYDQERMMYRRMDGTLIDSREAAITYYATLVDNTPTDPVPKRSPARLEQIVSPETRAKMSACHLGKKLTPEHRAKLSLVRTGKKRSPEARARMSAAQLGRTFTPETIEKMRIAAQERERKRKLAKLSLSATTRSPC